MQIKYELPYFERVASASEAEKDLANSSISCCLHHTRVVLFKATQREEYPDNSNGSSKLLLQHIKSLTANNIDLVAANVEVINLKCCHGNILETNSVSITNCILSKQL